jgi:signal transduction histidine kinase
LRPDILDHLGLISALEWQAEEFQRITGIPCDFICTAPEMILEKNISIHIFRIFQEILTNVARHSGATNVDAYLEKKDDHLIMEVATTAGIMSQLSIHHPLESWECDAYILSERYQNNRFSGHRLH